MVLFLSPQISRPWRRSCPFPVVLLLSPQTPFSLEEELPLPCGVAPLPWSLLPLEKELWLCPMASLTAPTSGSLPRLIG